MMTQHSTPFRRRVPALRVLTVTPTETPDASMLLFENDDRVLLESGDLLLLEG